MKKISTLFLLVCLAALGAHAQASKTGTLVATDTFPGPLSANWHVYTPTVDVTNANAEVVSSTSGARPYAAYSGATFSGDQWSEIILTANGSMSDIGPAVRVSAGNNFYAGYVSGGGKTVYLFRSVNGSIHTLAQSAFGAHTPVTCDTEELDVQGSTLTFYVNGVSVLSATDSTLATGVPGIQGNVVTANDLLSSSQGVSMWAGGIFGQPTITSLAPSSVPAGSAQFTLTINGTGFVSTSTAYWNGTALATTFVSSTQLTAVVPASLISASGAASVTLLPTPNSMFTITNGPVAIISLPAYYRGHSEEITVNLKDNAN